MFAIKVFEGLFLHNEPFLGDVPDAALLGFCYSKAVDGESF